MLQRRALTLSVRISGSLLLMPSVLSLLPHTVGMLDYVSSEAGEGRVPLDQGRASWIERAMCGSPGRSCQEPDHGNAPKPLLDSAVRLPSSCRAVHVPAYYAGPA